MNNWTENEKKLLLGYAQAPDDENIDEMIEYIRHMMYLEGNHPELNERSISSVKNMYYKLTNKELNK